MSGFIFIVNEKARNGRVGRLWEETLKHASELDLDYQVVKTEYPGHAIELSADTGSPNDIRVAVGGDGTFNEVANGVFDKGIPVTLIPLGNGNDYARNIGLSLDLKSNCFFPYEPVLEELDMPLINDVPFGSIACLGFDAEVNKFARGKKGFFGGTLGYIVCVIRALKAFEPFVIDIKIDDFHWSGKIMMVAISNGPYYGGGMKIAPEACMDNGLFDVCIVKEISKWELMKEFPKIFQGTHLSHPSVILKSGRTVEVLSEENGVVTLYFLF